MKLTLIKAPAATPSAKLADWGPVGEPVGQPIPKLRGVEAHEGPDAGIWECSPGKFRRQIKNAEFCHFIAGRCVFHADSGERLDGPAHHRLKPRRAGLPRLGFLKQPGILSAGPRLGSRVGGGR